MLRKFIFILLLIVPITSIGAQTLQDYCENARPFCSNGDELTAPNITGIPNTSSLACLYTTPNPTWSIIEIDDPGDIEIEIRQFDNNDNGLDVDFAVFGPFTNFENACGQITFEGCPSCPNNTNFYPFGNIVDCSYSPASIENLTINNAQSGQVYLLLTTNFSGDEGYISLSQTNFDENGVGTLTADLEVEITSDEAFIDANNDPSEIDQAILCGFDSITIKANSPFADEFIWYKDGLPIPGETSSTLIVTESDFYIVQAFYNQCNTESFSQTVNLKLYKEFGTVAAQSIVECDDLGNGIIDFDLDAFSESLGLGEDFVASYYTNITDANQAINPVSSPYSSAGETLIVRVEDINAQADNILGCRSLFLLDLIVDCDTIGFIEVSAFYDDNENAVFDDNEVSFSNGYFTYELNNDGIINVVQTSIGRFRIEDTDPLNTYDIDFYFYNQYEDCYEASITNFEDISVSIGEIISVEFPIVDFQTCEDISVNLINQQSPRPGFNHSNFLIIQNLGLNPVSGTVDYTLDSELVINDISLGANYSTVLTADGFSLDFINLEPNESIVVDITLTTPVTVELGQMVTNTVVYSNTEDDIVESNNSSSITEEVIGSFDPNDKVESHGPEIVYDDFIMSDEWLYYTIRFQNLGTAEAIFIRIEDELDAQLDETTFQMLRSSHDYMVTRTGSSLEWFFEDINLPAEQDDAEGSNGYVHFRIKPVAGYALGDVIPNSAAIYFDFNAPVITNTFNTTFVEPLSIEDERIISFGMYPNPAKDKVTIELNNSLPNDLEISLIDIQGKRINVPSSNFESSIELNVSSLNVGLYFVQLKKGNSIVVEKLIIE